MTAKRKRIKDVMGTRVRKIDTLTPAQEKRVGRNDLNKGKPYKKYLEVENEKNQKRH